MSIVDINITGGGSGGSLATDDQQIDISGYRNINIGGNTSSDGLRIRNLALTVQHEFNGVGDYRLLQGRFAQGGGVTSSGYGALFNKSGNTGTIGAFNSTTNSAGLYVLNQAQGRCARFLSNGSSTFQTGALIEVLGTGASNIGVQLDVKNSSGVNYAIDILSGDIKTPSGTGFSGTLNFNAPNSGDTASMTFDRGILVSSTQTP